MKENGKGDRTGTEKRNLVGGKGGKASIPDPDCDVTLGKMQTQMEICRLNGDRRVMVEVSKNGAAR